MINHALILFGFLLAQTMVPAMASAQTVEPANGDTATAGYEENVRQWQSLSETQREEIRQQVRSLDQRQRAAIKENAQRFHELPESEQSRILTNYRKFQQLSRENQAALKEKSRRFQAFSPEQRSALRQETRIQAEPAKIKPVIPERDGKNSQGGTLDPGRQPANNRPASESGQAFENQLRTFSGSPESQPALGQHNPFLSNGSPVRGGNSPEGANPGPGGMPGPGNGPAPQRSR